MPPADIAATPDLDARIKRIFDHLYANATVRTPAAIAAEVGKLLRTATHVERGAGLFPAFVLAPDIRRSLLAGDRKSTKEFARVVRQAFDAMNREWQFYSGEGIQLSDYDLTWCCAQIDGVVVSAGKRDVFGDAVEIFRTSWAKQSSGQFFTDARITHLAVQMLRFDPFAGDDLIDICCGTGGFLLAALDRIRLLAQNRIPGAEREQQVVVAGHRSLHGQEVDPEICDIANASLLCRLGVDRSPVVQRGNSLSSSAFGPNDPGTLHEGTHQCAASNPPFGTKITVKDPDILRRYELAATNGGRSATPRAPDVLLLEQNIRMLRPGTGRLAIVVPYQILSGPQTRYIREWLLRHAQLEAVVDLPGETFQPHTGTKTSLLVIRKREHVLPTPPEREEGNLFMATPRWIGHDRRGHPVYERTPDGKSSDRVLSDIEDVGCAFEAFLQGKDPGKVHSESFRVAVGRILQSPDLRMNARYYRLDDSAAVARRLPPGWKLVRLGDVCERIFCPSRFKRNYVGPSRDAVPFLGGANITELLADTEKWISRNDPKFAELVVREGWVLVTRSGSTGIVSTVPKAWDGVAMSEHVIRIIPRSEVMSPAWLQTYLRSAAGQRALAKGVFGSVIDEITTDFIAELEIPVPSDPQLLRHIVDRVSEAEHARERAIEGFRTAVAELDSCLTE